MATKVNYTDGEGQIFKAKIDALRPDQFLLIKKQKPTGLVEIELLNRNKKVVQFSDLELTNS